MSKVEKLLVFVRQRLDAAVEEILGVLENTFTKYEQEASLCQEVISRQHALLCAFNKPLVDVPTLDTFTQQLLVTNKGVPAPAQEQIREVDQAEIIQFTYKARCEASQSSVVPGAAVPDQDVHLVSSETEDSEDYSRESTVAGPPLKQPKPKRVLRPVGGLRCRVCSRIFRARRFLLRHVSSHLQEAEPACGLCSQRFETPENLKLHLQTHQPGARRRERRLQQDSEPDMKPETELKEHSCDDCGETFPQAWKKRRHKCQHLRKGRNNMKM